MSEKQFPIKVHWERPTHVRRVMPGEDGSGDLEGLPQVDLERPQSSLSGSEDYVTASPEVRRILSLEFARNRDQVEVIKNDLVRSVQRHPLDLDSVEVTIAQLTVRIRNTQAELEKIRHKNPALRHALKIKVDHRRVLLRRLREQDYKKFEWLLEKLNLVYKPRPAFWERIERKKHMARLTDLWCSEYQDHLLTQLKMENASKQPEFLREKAQTLEWIAKEERDLGLPSTVNLDEIAELKKRAQELEEKLRPSEDQEDLADKYFIYEPEKPAPKELLE